MKKEMKSIKDMTFGEIWDNYTYPSYLQLRESFGLPLTKEQQLILKNMKHNLTGTK